MKIKKAHILITVTLFAFLAIPFRSLIRRPIVKIVQVIRGRKTVEDRIAQYGEAVRKRLAPDFERINIQYPPKRIILLGLKSEKKLEVWVSDSEISKLLKTYDILGASGNLGPKLKEGDRQVPEGLYKIESLNPNSMYHLALRVNYPNELDKSNGAKDGRKNLGSDIMIHGKSCSIGCLAMGDTAAEELFILAAETGIQNISVILSPVDFRTTTLPPDLPQLPDWTKPLYKSIKNEMLKLKKPE